MQLVKEGEINEKNRGKKCEMTEPIVIIFSRKYQIFIYFYLTIFFNPLKLFFHYGKKQKFNKIYS